MFKMYTGRVRVLSTGETFLETENDNYVPIIFEGNQAAITPINKLISISLNKEGFVSTEYPWFVELKESQAEILPKTVKAGVYNFVSKDSDLEQNKVNNKAQFVEDFYRRFNYDIKTKGFVLEGIGCIPGPPTFCSNQVRAWERDNPEKMGDFVPTHHCMWGGNASACGHAYIGGSTNVTYKNMGCSDKTTVHELGHNLGWGHSGKESANGRIDQYGDPYCIMGSQPTRVGLNVIKQLDWLDKVIHIFSSQSMKIVPFDIDANSILPGEFKALVVGDYVISSRITNRHPLSVPKKEAGNIFIHYKKGSASVQYLNPLRVGEAVKLPNGAIVRNAEYANFGNTVQIEIDGLLPDPAIPDTSMPFPPLPEGARFDSRHSGIWYDPDFDGQGFEIFVKDGRFCVYWYTYEGSDRRFYYGAGNLGDADFDLYTTTNPQGFNNPSAYEIFSIGKGRLFFVDDRRGVFNYNTHEHGRGSCDLTLISGRKSSQNGVFMNDGRVGEGYTAHFWEDNVSFRWYTYGSPKPYSDKDGTQRWLECVGKEISPGQYTVDIIEYRKGEFLGYHKSPPTIVGNGNLKVIDEDNMIFDYVVNGDNFSGERTVEIRRLF